ncbi:MAG: TfoX/Sxy family protein [Eggerthellaceae bacterium]|nr:TfoX/Sxy family protein [Eggerthellaceae bacterium]
MPALTDLPNIGSRAAELLRAVGIDDAAQLAALGAEEAWLRLQTVDPGVCLHQLQALEGAVLGIPKAQLSAERKAELKAFAAAHRPAGGAR